MEGRSCDDAPMPSSARGEVTAAHLRGPRSVVVPLPPLEVDPARVAESALPHDPVILEAVFVTVAVSVVLHGVTAVWGADRYGRWYERAVADGADLAEGRDVGAPGVRRRFLAHDPP